MDGNEARQFGLFLIFWILYFLILYSTCTYFYLRLRGKPPKEGGRLVMMGDRTVPAKVAWEERDRALRKRFYRIGLVMMLVPLLLPFLVFLIGLIG